jgi:hypothetical protein
MSDIIIKSSAVYTDKCRSRSIAIDWPKSERTFFLSNASRYLKACIFDNNTTEMMTIWNIGGVILTGESLSRVLRFFPINIIPLVFYSDLLLCAVLTRGTNGPSLKKAMLLLVSRKHLIYWFIDRLTELILPHPDTLARKELICPLIFWYN